MLSQLGWGQFSSDVLPQPEALLWELSQLWEGSNQWLLYFSLGAGCFFLCRPASALQLGWGGEYPWVYHFSCGGISNSDILSVWDNGSSLACFVLLLGWELFLWFFLRPGRQLFLGDSISALLGTGFSLDSLSQTLGGLSLVFSFSIAGIFLNSEE